MGTKWTRRGGFAVFMVAIAGGAAVAGGVAGAGGAALGQGAGSTVRVAAAADLEPLLPAVLAAFEQRTGVHAEASYGSSATLAQQIVNGAPFDVFMAADMSFPQKVVDAGLAEQAKPVPYARGTLVLWARKDAPILHGGPLTFDILRNPALGSVAIANPEHAPYGRAAKAAITEMGLDGALGPKLRVAANIAQAAEYADTGNAEVGFVSLTSASTARLTTDGTYVAVPATAYPAIVQGAVTLKHGPDAADGDRLIEFLATPGTRALLAKSGLQPPD